MMNMLTMLQVRLASRGHIRILLSYILPALLFSALLNLPRLLFMTPIGKKAGSNPLLLQIGIYSQVEPGVYNFEKYYERNGKKKKGVKEKGRKKEEGGGEGMHFILIYFPPTHPNPKKYYEENGIGGGVSVYFSKPLKNYYKCRCYRNFFVIEKYTFFLQTKRLAEFSVKA